MSLIDKILRAGEGRTLKKFDQLATQVDALQEDFEALTDEELQAKTAEFKARLEEGETLDDLLVEAFATVREASWRILRMRPFHVQVMGGIALHKGNIAEMKTGEGKTLVATMPAYLRALTGKGVHVVTVNDYLAKYQSDIMARVYNFLGLTTGCVLVGQKPAERRKQYEADITYGTNNEFGFDYLRDNMASTLDDMVQRGHNYVIVDEVDSILIDEARTPLIISGPASGDVNHWYMEFARIARMLERDVDYEVDEKKKTIGVLEAGIDHVEDQLGVENLYEAANTPLIGFLNNSIRAKELFHKDKDYIVTDGEVLIVDEHTGRVLPGRRYNDGMHQAIEAKEGVEIQAENQTLATITLQNYFRLYPEGSRAGMTGTAETEAAEFASTYKIGVIPIPTNKPMIRKDQPDFVFPSEAGKLKAIIEDIAERHEKGQPVLVGTASVEKSELLSQLLKQRHIPHQVLNAKQHAREAAVVAMAGRKGAVTVATNMAGRGTDIMLGGNSEFIAQANLAAKGLDPKENADEYRAAWPIALEEADAAVQAEREEVRELGGLYVLGSERHESRRIDNQLRGRSGRQGDPGESRFYLSMEDDLMRLFNSGMAQRIMASGAYPEDLPLENKLVSRSIASAQHQVEARNFEIRKNVLKYDDVMTNQRELIYDERRRVLEGEDLEPQMKNFMRSLVTGIIDEKTGGISPAEWDLDVLWDTLRGYYPPSVTYQEVEEEHGGAGSLVREDLVEEIYGDITAVYEDAEEALKANPLARGQLGEEPMRDLERRVVVATVDRLWREHLYEMDYLKEGIGLRAMGQRDPLVEYKDEGAQMFQSMMERIKEESVQQVFSVSHQFERAFEQAKEQGLFKDDESAKESAEEPAAQAESADAPAPASPVAAAKAQVVIGEAQRLNLAKLSYSSSDGTATQGRATSSGASSNRAQRRASAKKARHRK
ncbi:preprotein translocase subunit SecA [Actinomycetaceae bacterium UMB8039B]|uniref:preprotein translocase subunit SecA n=1 Tax=unclassified Pauljensenia TaxID=2908895 RepID=UPI000AA81B05|nr:MULTISPECIES: preprotein translocase subunit SecA [unclassified Pauljensenia]MDK7781200.1 preprotein translocase subunit SecA [Actinomycetaceae bacterium UMB8041B]MDK8293604.1 preprotein translocase subunit SecA [Actinomycetaceae bacterium UMB8039B]MDK8608257.1 preprotein translocase subunit SecA [Actinomycetaceae bacterium UMB8041A]MDK8753747.1 preprotein translocase subunit SecA [Actinomycetaceae bacterium UMB8039A]MDK6830383.1 preprotein translocase subunit SecA [Pauljensenia sp. UMB8040